MADPSERTATQLANIEASSGMTTDDFFAVVSATGLDKHGKIVAFLKSDHDLTHGNANLTPTSSANEWQAAPRPTTR